MQWSVRGGEHKSGAGWGWGKVNVGRGSPLVEEESERVGVVWIGRHLRLEVADPFLAQVLKGRACEEEVAPCLGSVLVAEVAVPEPVASRSRVGGVE